VTRFATSDPSRARTIALGLIGVSTLMALCVSGCSDPTTRSSLLAASSTPSSTAPPASSTSTAPPPSSTTIAAIGSAYPVVIDWGRDAGVIAPVHGVNSGPVIDNDPAQPNRLDLYVMHDDGSGPSVAILHKAKRADFTVQKNRYLEAKIPQVRLHGTTQTDLTHVWKPTQSGLGQSYIPPGGLIPGTHTVFPPGGVLIDAGSAQNRYERKYAGEDPNLTSNYDWEVFDAGIQAILDVNALPIVRLGNAPYKKRLPNGTFSIVHGGDAPPDDNAVFAKVGIRIVERLLARVSRHLAPGQPMPTLHVELWNEPYFPEFWREVDAGGALVDIKVRAENYFKLYKKCYEAFYRDPGHPFDLADVVLVPQVPAALENLPNPSEPSQWQTRFLDLCASNGLRPTVIAPHLYAAIPGVQEAKLKTLEDGFARRWPAAPGQAPGQTQMLVTEWNRTVEKYAIRPGAVPFLANALIQFNDSYNASGSSVRVSGAHLFSAAKQIWTGAEDPGLPGVPGGRADANLPLSSGLLLEVYGKHLYGETPNRVQVVSGRFQDPAPTTQDLGVYRDFDVIAGRSDDRKTLHILASTFMAWDRPGSDPIYPEYSGRGEADFATNGLPTEHATAYEIRNVPLSGKVRIERWSEAFNEDETSYLAQFSNGGAGATLVLVESFVQPVVNGGVSFTFAQGMKQNSYDLIKVIAVGSPAPASR
jgi:hypothetical protein